MSLISKYIKSYKSGLLILTLSIVSLFLFVSINNNGILLFNGDSFETMYQFYVGGYTKLFEGNLLAYDFSMGLGANPIYNSFYFLLSPFFYITCFFPKEYLPYSFLVMTILKIILMFIFSTMWISKLTNNNKIVVITSLLFTFSGWVFFYLHYVFFLDHILVLPLLLYFSEKYLKENRSLGLIITIAYITFVNYYFAYLFIPFLLIYTIFRAFYERIEIKIIVFRLFKYFLFIILGVAIGAITLLPNAYVIINNPRLDNIKNFAPMNKYEIYKFVTSFLTPVTNRFDANYFINDSWYRFMGWGNGTNIYMGALSIILLSIFIVSKNNYKKLTISIFYIICFIFFLFPMFSYLFQATIDTRWFYYFNVVNVLMMVYVLEQIYSKLINNKRIIFGSLISISVILFFLLVSYHFKLNKIYMLKQLLYIEIFVIIIIIFYSISLIKCNRNIYIIVFIDIMLSILVFFSHNQLLDPSYVASENTDNLAITELQDGSFFRITQDSYGYWPSNNPFAKNMNSVSFYNSIYNYQTEDYIKRFKTTWSMPQRQGQDIAYSNLGVKYWLTKTYEHEAPYGFEIVDQINDISVFENMNFVELGFAYDNTINSKAVIDDSYLIQDLVMQDYMITDTSSNYEYTVDERLQLVASYQFYDQIKFFDSIWSSLLVFENLNHNDLKVTLYYNDNILKEYYYYGDNYFIINLHDLFYVSDIEITNLSDHEANINYYHLEQQYLDDKYDSKKNVSFHDTKIKNNYISAKIDLDRDMHVYTSIPYDTGWSVYVNGDKINYYKANYGFIGFDLAKGNYEVEFKYQIPMLRFGTLVSVISIIVLLVLKIRSLVK